MTRSSNFAADLHSDVPPDWYYTSIKRNVLQRYWHKRRFEEVGKLIETTSGRILDVGCADGMFTKIILDRSKATKVVGIDVLNDSVKWAKKHWKRNKRLIFKVGDAHDLKFKDGEFDAVFALEVLEHLQNPMKVLSEIMRVLKPGSYGVMLVPSDSLLFRLVWFFWTKFGPGRIWDHTHIQSFDKNNSLSINLEKLGFAIEVDEKFMLDMLNVVKVRKMSATQGD